MGRKGRGLSTRDSPGGSLTSGRANHPSSSCLLGHPSGPKGVQGNIEPGVMTPTSLKERGLSCGEQEEAGLTCSVGSREETLISKRELGGGGQGHNPCSTSFPDGSTGTLWSRKSVMLT